MSIGYPYGYERTTTAASIRAEFGSLEPGEASSKRVSVAGRIRTVRAHGRVAFADLMDSSGRIQLFAQHAVLGDDGMKAWSDVGVGDIVGAGGEIVMTRRGELSVKVDDFSVLAKCLKPMPDTWHGMTDVETRYRQRYLDFIINESARRVVETRARAAAAIRAFLGARGFLEVETPLLQPLAGGATARPFVTHLKALDMDLYLRVAPELYLKRLLIGGFERVYELNRNFRNEGVSTRHSPEFTMLEAYEAYVDYHHTMGLVQDLVRAIAHAVSGSLTPAFGDDKIDFAGDWPKMTMFEAIREYAGHDLEGAWRDEDFGRIRDAALALGVAIEHSWSPGKVIGEIYETRIERAVSGPAFIVGFPKDISPLAKEHRAIPGFTEHADLLIRGVEIAPIYSELNDPVEQRRRFEQQAAARSAGDDEAQLADEDFLEALSYGMPPAGGFGLGVDRLLMLLSGAESIREVVLFPTLRPR